MPRGLHHRIHVLLCKEHYPIERARSYQFQSCEGQRRGAEVTKADFDIVEEGVVFCVLEEA